MFENISGSLAATLQLIAIFCGLSHQIYFIVKNKSSKGVSLFMTGTNLASCMAWFNRGLIIGESTLVVPQVAAIFLLTILLVVTVRYRN